MASTSLGAPYVLSEAGARQLVEMTAGGSARLSTPGFSSSLVEGKAVDSKLTALQKLVQARPVSKK